jgi:hypothetical protein
VPKVRESTLAVDYRPISITSSIGKLAEHFLLEQITRAIDANLPSCQNGFRRGRSTTDALINIEHKIIQAMDKCSGAIRIAVISFDVSRAFDSISHARLLDHLRERFEVPLYARRWLHSFRVGRIQRVRVGSAQSAIGPVLYTAATAGPKKVQLSTEASIPVYADDIQGDQEGAGRRQQA